jgi:hypothetical protein
MQTYIRSDPRMALFKVGDTIADAFPEQIDGNGYHRVRDVEHHEKMRILQSWECPSGRSMHNRAEIVMDENRVIEGIEAVPLNRETFERLHFIGNECSTDAARLSGRPIQELMGADLVGLLREKL